ncbi:MAG TPA: hypothetical protein DDY54_11590, partial [Deltaproteobacteria bacterium]|nr:hypothetical protein [Deltaproteobacteria bacterium]
MVLGTTVLVVMSTGCADSEKEEFEETSTTSSAFTVSSVYPADNATGVSVSDNITVTFSGSLSSSGVDNQTLQLLDNG